MANKMTEERRTRNKKKFGTISLETKRKNISK